MPAITDEKWAVADVAFVYAANGRFVAQVSDSDRASLVAAAPALYRALASVEWVNSEDGPACPRCGGRQETGKLNDHFGHKPDCALNGALKQARGET